MQNPKAIIFTYLTQRQKTQLLGTLKAYCLKFPQLNSIELTDKFLEDEKYYLDIDNPHFEFVGEYLTNDTFFSDVKRMFDYLKYEVEQKEKMRPYLDRQKELAREMRKKAQEFKMSKSAPTKKQLLFYDKLTKAHHVEKKDLTGASKLDLRNWIMELIDEKSN